jgi:alcohol dehydrogenase, propanol-preferring
MRVTDRQGSEAVPNFVNNTKTVPTSIEMLRKRRKIVMVGLFGGSRYEFGTNSVESIYLYEHYTGKFAELIELVALSKMGKIRSVVTRRFTLEQANERWKI